TSLDYADDITLLSSNSKEIADMFNTVKHWCNYNSMKINPEKSAYAWNNNTDTAENLKVEDKTIEYLGSSGSYKYLGVYLNFKLNWQPQMNILNDIYKNSVGKIARKYYLSNQMKVLLVNSIAQATITYRMDTVLFDNK